jgi:hypothetical protein
MTTPVISLLANIPEPEADKSKEIHSLDGHWVKSPTSAQLIFIKREDKKNEV